MQKSLQLAVCACGEALAVVAGAAACYIATAAAAACEMPGVAEHTLPATLLI